MDTKIRKSGSIPGLATTFASKKRRCKTPIKEGWHLANSVTEDMGGISLAPAYSLKQQRTIARRNRSRKGMARSSKSVWSGI